MLLNIHNEESLRIRNKKFSSEWPFNVTSRTLNQLKINEQNNVDLTLRDQRYSNRNINGESTLIYSMRR
jgi:hypothetical protein